MHARSSYRFLLVVLLLIVTASSGFAQYRAALQGTVTDPSGAAIPGATVTIKSTETNLTRTVQSSDAGVYTIPSLAPGLYSITIEKQGFRKNEVSNFRIIADVSQGANFQLQIGDVSQSVTVSAEAVPPINTENAQISGTVSAREIQRLPSFGRDVFQLAQLAPGVIGDASRGNGGDTADLPGNQGGGKSGAKTGVFSTENRPQVSVNGGRTNANGVNLDGISISSVTWGGAAIVTPNEDSVKEVRIVSNQYDAEYGRFAGGQIQVISQNGTNNFHGSAFFKADRPGLNAKQRWTGAEANARAPIKNTSKFNDWGGSIGGPIVKNRLFGFFSYETIRNHSTDVNSGSWSETPQFLNVAKTSGGPNAKLYGNYPGMAIVPKQILDQSCDTAGFVEGVNCHLIPGSGLDIVNASALALDGVPDIMFATAAGPRNDTNEQFNGRVDFQATSKDLIAFSMYRVPVAQSFPNGWRAANQFHHDATNEAETVLWNRTFSPTFLNELRANAAGWRWNELTSNPQIALGLPQPLYIGDPNKGNKIGNISINDNPLGGPAGSVFSQWTYSIKDTATKVQGSHTIKFGGDVTKLHYLQEAPWSARPQFGFNSLYDFLTDHATKESGVFNPQTGIPTDVRKDARQTLLGFFAQDDWKVRQNLTLNLGLRWEYFSPLTFLNNQLATVVLGQGNAALTGMKIRVGGDLYNADKHNFGPQIGFAWSPGSIKGHAFNNKLVIRGGAGIGYTGEQVGITANGWGNPPFTNNGASLPEGQVVYALPSNPNQFKPFPANPNTISGFDANNIPTSSIVGVTAFPADFNTATTYRYSLDTQYEFLPTWVASIGYQGSISRHLTRQYNLNQVLGAKGIPLNPHVNNVDYYNPDGKAHSNALIVTLNHNFSREFQFNAQYRFSKSMDNESGPFSISPYQWNNNADWGLSDFDVRHLWKFYGIYSPTFFHGDRSWMEKVLGGWSLSGILNYHTGYPFNPFSGSSCDIVYAGGNCQNGTTTNLMPAFYNGKAGTDYSNSAFLQQGGNFQQGVLAYFTPATFAPCALPFPQSCIALPQAPGIKRNAFRGPRYMDVDATLSKSFGFPKLPILGEGTRFEFRANAFNLFNNQNLTGVDAFMGSWDNTTPIPFTVFKANPNFGTALNALGGRTIELQARFSF